MVFWNKDLLFCEISPTTYKISMQKEILKRHLQNIKARKKFANVKSDDLLEHVVWQHSSDLIKRGPGIDLDLQKGKAVNIDIASKTMDKVIIQPGEEFSFWSLVGKITKKKGYLDGRVIVGDSVEPGRGGGLCNLANTLHLLIVHSPMEITELHTHSDALAPDFDHRRPFANGTSVAYNNQDYRFKNSSDQAVQIHLWVEDETLYGELRSESAFPYAYRLVEEDHHFKKEGEKFYRHSMIYREKFDKETESLLDRELILKNHSEVMFDYELIPEEMILP